jgi:hypothetical protein
MCISKLTENILYIFKMQNFMIEDMHAYFNSELKDYYTKCKYTCNCFVLLLRTAFTSNITMDVLNIHIEICIIDTSIYKG